MHNAGYFKKNENGWNKEDQSYSPMHHDFILCNVYYNFLDIFQNFELKHYLTENAEDIFLQLHQL